MKNNTFFTQMDQELRALWQRRRDAKRKKEQAKNIYGWDAEETKQAIAELEALTIPYSEGALMAHRAWQESVEYDDKVLVLSDHLWDREVHDFVETLKAAGITEFIFTNHSTGLMEDLHALDAEGFGFGGYRTVDRPHAWGNVEHVCGIRLAL